MYIVFYRNSIEYPHVNTTSEDYNTHDDENDLEKTFDNDETVINQYKTRQNSRLRSIHDFNRINFLLAPLPCFKKMTELMAFKNGGGLNLFLIHSTYIQKSRVAWLLACTAVYNIFESFDKVSDSFRFERDALKSLDEYSEEEVGRDDDRSNVDCLSSFDDNNYEEQNFLNWEKELSQSLQDEHAGNWILHTH